MGRTEFHQKLQVLIEIFDMHYKEDGDTSPYHGLTEEEYAEARSKFEAWCSSPHGKHGLEISDILSSPDDALMAWLALTALNKSTRQK